MTELPPDLINILANFWKKHGATLETSYKWKLLTKPPIPFPEIAGETDYQKTIRLRHALSDDWKKSDLQTRKDRALWYVKVWGGVKGNKPETLLEYVSQTPDEIVQSRGIRGISSWSKVLAMQDPDRYAIYDARVVFSLNLLQLESGGKLLLRYPIPVGQNPKLRAASAKLRSNTEYLEAATLPKDEVYRSYLSLLRKVSAERPIEELEMLLFSEAVALAGRL